MNAQQLKNAILQEAIEGRLVPQDPNDEPASVLLQRIRKEKERLVKEGKLKKKDLKVKPISEEEKPFEIPEGWEWVRFGTITINRDSERIPLSVDERSKLMKTYDYYGASGVIDKVDKYLFNKPLLLIGEDGANLINRSTPIAFIAKGKYWVNNHAHVLDYVNEDLMQYMCWYINAISLVDYVTGTAQPKMNQEKMNSILVALPPLEEQKRIVTKIEELLPKVEEYGKAQEALDKLNAELPERLKKSILQEAISGRLVPQDPNDEPASILLDRIRQEKQRLVKEGKLKKKDLEETPISEDEKPFEIPEGWEWCRVKTILNVYSARRVHEKDWRTSGIPFYRAREIGKLADNGYVNNELFIEPALYQEFSKSGVPLTGDLMVTAVGTLGKTYIVKEGEVFYYKDGSVLCFNNKFKMDPQFLKYYIESPTFIDQYANESQGTTVATLTMVRVNEYLIPLPPLAEQHRIVAKLEQLLGEIDKLKA